MKNLIIILSLVLSTNIASADPIQNGWESISGLVEIYKLPWGGTTIKPKKEGYEVEIVGGDNIHPIHIRCIGNYDYVDFVVSTETNGARMYRSGEAEESPVIEVDAKSVREKIIKWQSFELGKIKYNSENNILDLDTTSDATYDILNCTKVISI